MNKNLINSIATHQVNKSDSRLVNQGRIAQDLSPPPSGRGYPSWRKQSPLPGAALPVSGIGFQPMVIEIIGETPMPH